MCAEQNEKQSVKRNDLEISTNLEMHGNLLKTLEAENNALHKNINITNE